VVLGVAREAGQDDQGGAAVEAGIAGFEHGQIIEGEGKLGTGVDGEGQAMGTG
jgi:hypothetical protein